MKFAELPYERPSIDEIKAELNRLLEEFKAAGTSDEAFAVYRRYDSV